MRKTARLVNIKAAVELEINAAIPELRKQIAAGVRRALESTDISRMAKQETDDIINDLIRGEIHQAIKEVTHEAARENIKSATKEAVETLFRQWLAWSGGEPKPQSIERLSKLKLDL